MTVSFVKRLEKTRKQLEADGLAGFIVPYTDAFQSHNRVAVGAERLKWLTGFRGSAGVAVIGLTQAAVFVDSRYTLSSRAQIDTALYNIIGDDSDVTPASYAKALGGVIGYDPFLHTKADLKPYLEAGVKLQPVAHNPVDAAWGHKDAPHYKAVQHDSAYAGLNVADKIELIAKADAGLVITQPDSVSWLLNVRVPQLEITPVVHGYVLLNAGHAVLFTDVACADMPQFGNHVSVRPLADIVQGLQDAAKVQTNWLLDDTVTPVAFADMLRAAGATVNHVQDPVTWPKAIKNATEQAGIRASHIRDGVAVTRFLQRIDTGVALKETEIAQLVLDSRARDKTCFTHSFEPIVGFNENGAFVHGQVPDAQVKLVKGDGLLLIDSGGQYMDGTTDITRTVVIGTPTADMRRCFTLVLKGHIALARARFPEGTPGVALDVLARQYLWQAGLNYGHGTGHGVGYCLNVHEGPCNISPRATRAAEPLKAGILISNEPGYYREGGFGIRHENLYLVVPDDMEGFLRFEPVTLAPFDIRGLDVSLLTDDERNWLNGYHAHVRNTLFPLLEPQVAAWLTAATVPV